MGRPEEERVHQIAKDVAPEVVENLQEHLAKEKAIMVAVELHDVDWRDGARLTGERFLWIKARGVSEHFFNFTYAKRAPLSHPRLPWQTTAHY